MPTQARRSTEAALAAFAQSLEAAFWRTLAGPEKALERDLGNVWGQWAARAVDAANADLDPIAALDEIGPGQAVTVLRARMLAVMDGAAALVRDLVERSKDAEAFRAERVRYAATMSLTRARGFQEAQKTVIRRVLADAAEPGRNPRAAAKDIREALSGTIGKSRARTIARTELHAAAGWAQWQEATRQAERFGLKFLKEWRSTHDARVRPSHAAANGQRVGLEGSFIVGGAALRFPGDPLGPGREVINCRCVSVFVPARLADRIPQARPIGDAVPEPAPADAPEPTPQDAPARWSGVDQAADSKAAADRKALRKGIEKLAGGPAAPLRDRADRFTRDLNARTRNSVPRGSEANLEEGLALDLYAREAIRGRSPLKAGGRSVAMAADRALNTVEGRDALGARVEISTRPLEGMRFKPGDTIEPDLLPDLETPFVANRTPRMRTGESVFLKIRNTGAAHEIDVVTPNGRPIMIPGSRLVVVSDEVFSGTRIVEVDAVPLRNWDHAAARRAFNEGKSPDELRPEGTALAQANAAGRRYVRSNGAKDGNEWIAIVDERTGRTLAGTWGEKGSTGWPFEFDGDLFDLERRRFTVHHNHPDKGRTDSPLSGADYGVASRNGVNRMLAHGVNGSAFQSEVLVKGGRQLTLAVDGAAKRAYKKVEARFVEIIRGSKTGRRDAVNVLYQGVAQGLEQAGLIKRFDKLDPSTRAFFAEHKDLIDAVAAMVERDMKRGSYMRKAKEKSEHMPPMIIDAPIDQAGRDAMRARLKKLLTGEDLAAALEILDGAPLIGGSNA